MSAARLTCRECVPARSFCYLGGPVAYMGDNFLKEFSVQHARAARALFFIMSGYLSSSLLVAFSLDVEKRKEDRDRKDEKERERERSESRLSLQCCLDRSRTFPHEAIL